MCELYIYSFGAHAKLIIHFSISASLITRIMLNIRDIVPPGRSTRPTTDEPFSYDTPDGTSVAPLSTIVHGVGSATPCSPSWRSPAWTAPGTNYTYDPENGVCTDCAR